MGISLSLYDFFAHLVPGGVFLSALLYAFQEAWLRSPAFTALTTAQLLCFGLAAYVLGYAIDPLAYGWYRLFQPRRDSNDGAQAAAQSLTKEYPTIEVAPQTMSWFVVLAYIRRRNLSMAQEIERLNVTHIMLRGVSLGLLFFALAFCLKVVTAPKPWISVVLSLLSMAASYSLMQNAIKFRRWFYKSIYQSVLALNLKPEQIPVQYIGKGLK